MSDISINVENLGKRYRVGQFAGYRTLREGLTNAISAPLRRFRSPGQPARNHDSDFFWALKDISFQVRQGEAIGIIGRNGAGKSTLLKILTRITEPTEGRAEIRGRVSSLLEVGTGFHPELTGRENVYLNGAVLGMKKGEIDRKFDEIVAFSGVEKFLDTPVKRYSSGMQVRLAFAVAAHLEPEVLLVDEVLAVGDAAFQKKCLGKMGEVTSGGRTVLFVSHNMAAMRALCPRGILLDEGKIVADTTSPDAILQYYERLKRIEVDAETDIMNSKKRRGSGAVRFSSIRVEDKAGQACNKFRSDETIRFVLSYRVFSRVDELYVSVVLCSGQSRDIVTSTNFAISRKALAQGHNGTVTIEFPKANLRPGEYPMYYWLGNRLMQPFDVVDDLTLPLLIYTDKSLEELGFNPTQPNGYFDIEARMVQM